MSDDVFSDLPREASPARDLWPEIAARIAAGPASAPAPPPRRRLFRPLVRLAAAVLLFASGVLVGRGLERDAPAEPAGSPGRGDALAPAVEVQRAGTEYVAALATLRSQQDPGTREQGREAALAALQGAAQELARLAPEDRAARRLLDTVSTTRIAPSIAPETASGTVHADRERPVRTVRF